VGGDESRASASSASENDTDYDEQGGEKYQSAFYVYEELASNPNTTAPLSIVGQAVAELHLGRLPEAEAALSSAIQKYPEDAELIANSVVLNVLSGKDTTELTSYVSRPFSLPSILIQPYRLQTSSIHPAHSPPSRRFGRKELFL
jgi:hypothetical protein